MPATRKPQEEPKRTCGFYYPDHNGECQLCDEPFDAHERWARLPLGAAEARLIHLLRIHSHQGWPYLRLFLSLLDVQAVPRKPRPRRKARVR